jgi:ABC-type uncharacterized transport system permease subunit
MEFVPVLAMALLVVSIINLVKYAKAKDWNGIATTLAVWLAGVIVVLLVSQTDFAAGITIADRTLDTYNFWSLVFIGLTLSSIGQFANEIRAALDNHDTTVKPPLVDSPPSPGPQPPS